MNDAQVGQSPFGRSSATRRTPPEGPGTPKTISEWARQPPNPQQHRVNQPLGEEEHLAQLAQDEGKIFQELGEKLGAANSVMLGAKNIHKMLRDNITYAVALYEQLRGYREAFADNPIKVQKDVVKVSKAVQVNREDPILKQTGREERSKRILSESPKVETPPKKQKNDRTMSIINEDRQLKDGNVPIAEDFQIVRHRKGKREKKSSGRETERRRDSGEAIAIKTTEKMTYADIIKRMKTNVKPDEMGIEVKAIRRTQAGELLVKLQKGDGHAGKLKEALASTLGEEVTIRSVTKQCVMDIRDMDESTDEQDVLEALVKATKVEDPTAVKVLNLREAHGKTKQALVQVPTSVVPALLETGKITVGWLKCRIREKRRNSICFRCLEPGHLASMCNGVDRTNVCRRCCQPGHKARECKANKRCAKCEERGLQDTAHYIGGPRCVGNNKKLPR